MILKLQELYFRVPVRIISLNFSEEETHLQKHQGKATAVYKLQKVLKMFIIFNFYWSILNLQNGLISGVQKSESVTHIHISTLFFFF